MKQVIYPALMTGILFITPALAHQLPLSGNDIADAERYDTKDHGGGNQTEGKDIGLRRRTAEGGWTHLKAGATDEKVLSNWNVYGKPFYAMASGTVIGCWRNAPENTPGSYHPDYKPGFKIPGGGNLLWIRQDDGLIALYAHARPGSIPASICPNNAKLLTGNSGGGPAGVILAETQVVNGARIQAGQKLGEIGNSGASEGGPHLHVHMEKDGSPFPGIGVPMNFDRGLTTPWISKASLDGPWTSVAGKPLPNALILFWPPRPIGNYTLNGIAGTSHQRYVEHFANSGMLPNTITCTANGATYNTKWIPATGQWASFHDMSPATATAKHSYYTQQGYTRTSNYICGAVSVAVWRK